MDEAELAKQRSRLRRFPQYKDAADEALNARIISAAKRRAKTRRVVAPPPSDPNALPDPPPEPERLLPEKWRPLFRRQVKELMARVKDDVDIVLFETIIENHVLNVLTYRIALAGGASLRDLKDLNTAVLATATALGLPVTQRRAGHKRSEGSVIDAFNASVKRVQEGEEGRAERLRTAEARSMSKVQPESQSDD